MTSLVRSEVKKFTSVRSMWGLLLVALALSAFSVMAPGDNVIAHVEDPLREQQYFYVLSLLIRVLAFVVGVRVMSDEFKHGTIAQSLLVEPRRHRVIGAKIIAVSLVALLMATIAEMTMLAGAQYMAVTNNVSFALSSSDIPAIIGFAVSTLAWMLIGLGLGTLIRSQSLVLVVGLIWLMGAEDLIAGRLGSFGSHMPGREALAVATAIDGHMLLTGMAVLMGYIVALMIGARVVLHRRDIA